MLKERLTECFTTLKTVTGIAWIDEDFGQIDQYQEKPSVKLPCALVLFNQDADALGGDEYDLTNQFTIRLAHNRLGDRSANADSAQATTLAKLDLSDEVITAFTDAGYYYTGMVTERRSDGISCRALSFKQTI